MFRALSSHLLSDLSLDNHKRDDTFQHLLETIKICDKANDLEEQQHIGSIIVGKMLQHSREIAKMKLDACRSERHSSNDLDGTKKAVTGFGGHQCDACGKLVEDKNEMMKCCGICQLAFYCSRACQKKQWKDHKTICQKSGEFLQGDCVVFTGQSDWISHARNSSKWTMICCARDVFQVALPN